MENIKKLEELLKSDIMVELKNSIEEITKYLSKKKNDNNAKEELQNMKDLKDDFSSLLKDIENGNVSDEEASEIIEELQEMRLDEHDV